MKCITNSKYTQKKVTQNGNFNPFYCCDNLKNFKKRTFKVNIYDVNGNNFHFNKTYFKTMYLYLLTRILCLYTDNLLININFLLNKNRILIDVTTLLIRPCTF